MVRSGSQRSRWKTREQEGFKINGGDNFKKVVIMLYTMDKGIHWIKETQRSLKILSEDP